MARSPAVTSRVAGSRASSPARGELGEVERLGQVVVGAAVEPAHTVADLVARGHHEDGHDADLAQAAAEREPVHPGEHQVEHDEVRREGAEGAEGAQPLAAVGRHLHRVALVRQAQAHKVGDGALVLDHQHPRPLVALAYGHPAPLPRL